ncbi:MAG: WD40/YVTN/BNR-like repeat-containing protein [Thermoanaerobaculia bacterium]
MNWWSRAGCGVAIGLAGWLAQPTLAADRTAGPPGQIAAVVLERQGYRIGVTPPPAAVYAATDQGVFRGGPGEGAWNRVDPADDITALAISQREKTPSGPLVAHRSRVDYETILFAGDRRGRVRRTSDGGETWADAAPGGTLGQITVLLADAAGGVWAGTSERGLFRSEDGGGRWTGTGTALPRPVHALAADPVRREVLHAGAGGGLYRSADGGRTWSAAPLGPPGSTFAVTSVAVDPGVPSTVFAAGRLSCPGCPGGPGPATASFRSANGGASWTRLEKAVLGPLVFGKDGSVLHAATPDGALQSRDGGSTWSPVAGDPDPPRAVLAIDADWPGRVYARSAAGGLIRLDARCAAAASALCLIGGRFRIEVEWDAADREGGAPAGALALTDRTGSFWLRRPSNVSLCVEIRDARSSNGHFWLDFDARTIRGFAVVVTDMGTGASTRYSHPEGQRTKFTDHEAF